jgi:hypothetical protein
VTDLQGFPNDKIGKSKILDMVCTARNSENTDEDNTEETCLIKRQRRGADVMTKKYDNKILT